MGDDVTRELIERLTPLAASSNGVGVLEKVARGAGATRWFFCRTISEIEEVLPQLRPGSRVDSSLTTESSANTSLIRLNDK
jgi:hypothetical protein